MTTFTRTYSDNKNAESRMSAKERRTLGVSVVCHGHTVELFKPFEFSIRIKKNNNKNHISFLILRNSLLYFRSSRLNDNDFFMGRTIFTIKKEARQNPIKN